MRISIHLCFDGQCEAAFAFYQKLLGGEITTMLKYGDSPIADTVDPRWRDRILHATLRLDDQELLGADVRPEDYGRPRGFYALLSLPGLAEAKRVFDALAEGGSVHMPLQKTFWSEGFGVLTDRFGVPWEIASR
jgi:PhnB protein